MLQQNCFTYFHVNIQFEVTHGGQHQEQGACHLAALTTSRRKRSTSPSPMAGALKVWSKNADPQAALPTEWGPRKWPGTYANPPSGGSMHVLSENHLWEKRHFQGPQSWTSECSCYSPLGQSFWGHAPSPPWALQITSVPLIAPLTSLQPTALWLSFAQAD